MKKIILIAVAAAMYFAVAFAAVPEPDTKPASASSTKRVGITEKYVLKEGVVKDIKESNGIYSLLMSGQDMFHGFTFQSDISVLDALDFTYKDPSVLKPGMEIAVAYECGSAAARLIQAVACPSVIIIKNGKNVNLSVYDDSHTAYDMSLKLIMSDSTPIYDLKSKTECPCDITLKEAIVVFDTKNGCFPPETTPDFVLILRDLLEEQKTEN